jgi:hypothetical protein
MTNAVVGSPLPIGSDRKPCVSRRSPGEHHCTAMSGSETPPPHHNLIPTFFVER